MAATPPLSDQHFKMAVPALRGFMLHYLQGNDFGGQQKKVAVPGWTVLGVGCVCVCGGVFFNES